MGQAKKRMGRIQRRTHIVTTDPKIPYGWKRITGRSQKGDGIWNGEKFVRVKKEYPHSEGMPGFRLIIRKCEVVQPTLIGVDLAGGPDKSVITLTDGNGNNARNLSREDYETLKSMGMLWEHHPDAPAEWPGTEERR